MLIMVAAVSFMLFIGVGYWTGFVSVGREQAHEKLEISSAAVVNVDGEKYLKISIKNVGPKEVKLEYIVLNGTVTSYFIQTYSILVESRYLTMPSSFQTELYLPLKTSRDLSVEVRLHTVSGSDFTKTVSL